MRAIAACVLLFLTPAAMAASIDALHVEHEATRYRMTVSARLDASAADSHAILHNVHALPRINPGVELAVALPPVQKGSERWQTRTRICIGPICRHLLQVQDVWSSRDGTAFEMRARIVPDSGNLRSGDAHWRFAPCGTQTCLQFRTTIEPAFWVPPLLGPWLIERAMRNEARVTAEGIETLARSLHKTAMP